MGKALPMPWDGQHCQRAEKMASLPITQERNCLSAGSASFRSNQKRPGPKISNCLIAIMAEFLRVVTKFVLFQSVCRLLFPGSSIR